MYGKGNLKLNCKQKLKALLSAKMLVKGGINIEEQWCTKPWLGSYRICRPSLCRHTHNMLRVNTRHQCGQIIPLRLNLTFF